MIFYFSATGNSKYVAARLAKAANDTTISITDCIKTKNFDFTANDSESIGFVTPVYFLGLPTAVADFLSQLKLRTTGKHYTYHIATCGAVLPGQTHHMVSQFRKVGDLQLDGSFCVRMIDTWTPTPDLTNKKAIQNSLANAENEIEDIIKNVSNRAAGNLHSHSMFFVNLIYAFYKNGRRTKKFTVLPSCIGCELCKNQCPVSAIEMQNNMPIWVKAQCTLCLGCLHRCPKFAIQYGKRTHKYGQYLNPNVEL